MGTAQSSLSLSGGEPSDFAISIQNLSKQGRNAELEQFLEKIFKLTENDKNGSYTKEDYWNDLHSDDNKALKFALKRGDAETLKIFKRAGVILLNGETFRDIRSSMIKAIKNDERELIVALADYPFLAFGNGTDFLSSGQDKKLREKSVILAAEKGNANLIDFLFQLKYINFSTDREEIACRKQTCIVVGSEGLRERRKKRGLIRSSVDVIYDIFHDAKELIRTNENEPLFKAAEGGHSEVIRVLKKYGLRKEDVRTNRLEIFKIAIEQGHSNFLEAIKTNFREIKINTQEDLKELSKSVDIAEENGFSEVLDVLENVYGIVLSEAPPLQESGEDHHLEEFSFGGGELKKCFDFVSDFDDVEIEEYLNRNPSDNIVIVAALKDGENKAAICSSKSYLKRFLRQDRFVEDPFVKIPAITTGGGIVYVRKTNLSKVVRTPHSQRLFCLVPESGGGTVQETSFARRTGGVEEAAPVYKIVKCR